MAIANALDCQAPFRFGITDALAVRAIPIEIEVPNLPARTAIGDFPSDL